MKYNPLKDDQKAIVEIVIKRLVHRTAIEIEGWKRIPAVRRLFQAANLEVYFIFILHIISYEGF